MDFSAQYLQRPIPIEGNLIKRDWLKTYLVPPQPQPGDTYVISWDTAMKATGIADYSVGTVWHIQGDNCYLRDLIRNRFDFPELKRAVIRQGIAAGGARKRGVALPCVTTAYITLGHARQRSVTSLRPTTSTPVPSQNLLRLRKSSDSRRICVRNHQDSARPACWRP